MNALRLIWNYLNGKKTLIGTLVFFLAIKIKEAGLVDNNLLANLDENLTILATILALFGIGHKVVKFSGKRWSKK